MIRDLGFFLTEALVGIRRSALMTAISVATVTISLLIFGIFLILTLNITHLTNFFTSKLELRVFLNSDLTKNQLLEFQAILKQNAHIKSFEFVDKEDAWSDFKIRYQSLDLTQLIDDNPLPDAYRVLVFEPEFLPDLAVTLKKYTEYVDDVAYRASAAEKIEIFSKVFKGVGLILVGLLMLATLLIIFNTIRLTILARKEEITIMQLVGATSSFIKGPFIIEGIIIGTLGSSLALVLLKNSYDLFIQFIELKMPFFPIFTHGQELGWVYLSLFGFGTVLGVLGAYLSISRTIKMTI